MKSILADCLQAMPKVEIHVHLVGAIAAEIVYQMAQKNQVEIPVTSLEEWKSFYQFRDLAHFVEVYTIASRCIQTPEDYVLIVEQFLKHQSEQNIKYSEVHFSTTLHVNKFSDDELFHALETGAVQGETNYGSRVRFIATISRHQPDLQNRALECALLGQERGIIVGLGLAGLETGHPPEGFTETFAEAKRQGLRVVAHGGETEGANSIWGALKNLQVERIGHGVRCLEDNALVEELRISQTPLEVSPQSNYCLGVVPRAQPHPIRQMVDAGLYCTLNSDDPPMFNTNLVNEYSTLATQGFSWEELWQLNLNTLEATFLREAEKAAYRIQWQGFLETLGEE
ncbi:adenosine deaminase [Leptolyngbya sp. NK1-12]|uniref:Adenosine deaminase n=1 Tax=Leptolyngbya sp. NK1-12 TaxID=2547451 RepID=A0AA96WX51_9CYAN|nr:adenosine deaminase [Leptolyngbya sp. NK1-12]WNZ25842.1 adenosine deaminase [Leptolyngbya sp. NK1-12]